jgi:hypothetical protein
MYRRGTVTALAIAAVAAAGLVPAFAATAKPKPKPLKGTWSFTDTTPDPTMSALETAGKAKQGECLAAVVPSSPVDVNVHTIKLARKGTLTVLGHNKLDWAMEIADAKGRYLSGSDGATPQVAEGTSYTVTKPGTYQVVFCNLTGEPTTTADYTYKFR